MASRQVKQVLSKVTFVEVDSTGSSDASEFTYKLPKRVGTDRNEVNGFRVEWAAIPHTWHQIDARRNTFYFNRGGAKTAVFVASKYGTYSPDELASELQTLMNAADANTYVVSYDDNTGKFTISGAAAFTISNATAAGSSSLSIHRFLGFHSSSDTASATSHVSDGVANAVMDSVIQIHCPELWTKDRGSLIASIPVSSNYLGTTYWEASSPIIHQVDLHGLTSLTFQLKYQSDGKKVQLNGNDWQALLVLYHGVVETPTYTALGWPGRMGHFHNRGAWPQGCVGPRR